MKKAIFLDRDGIINVDTNYLWRIEDLIWNDGIFELLTHLQSLGYLLIIITNQSGIARGYYTQKDFENLSAHMSEIMARNGIKITDIFHCPHAPKDSCTCRKPSGEMITNACKKWNIDPTKSYMIGDKPSDIQAGQNAKIAYNINVSKNPYQNATHNVQNIKEIMQIIKS